MEAIVRAVVAGDDLASLIGEYQRESGASFSKTSDRLMVTVAEAFLDGRLTYSDADQVANSWWSEMCDPVRLEGESIPDLARAIFEAFDEGEYDHGDGLDPAEHYAIPLLRSALDRWTKDGSNN